MRTRLYGGVRGQVNTKGGEHLQLVFTSYSIDKEPFLCGKALEGEREVRGQMRRNT